MLATACSAPSKLNTVLLQTDISKLAAEHGFSAAYCITPLPQDGAPQGVKTLVILARAYVPGGKLVDAFYPASNAAYHAARAMASALEKRFDVQTWHLNSVRLKPLCARHAAFGRGMNTLNYLPEMGSRFCMELLGLALPVTCSKMPAYPAGELACGTCRRCMQACPTGAITESGFEKERCIRFYMLSGKPMPKEMRPFIGTAAKGIVGCDICQRVCPANRMVEEKGQEEERFTLAELLDCSPETMREFADLYGKNYAIRNRILAQAVLAAANMGNKENQRAIAILKGSPSPVVADHACWAEEKMK